MRVRQTQCLAALATDGPTVNPAEAEGDVPHPAALAGCIVAVGRDCDRIAFGVLFRYFGPRLKTYFMRYATVDETTADELVQDAMLLVWRKAALFDPARAAASTWIFSIARNLRVDAWRLERRRAALAEGVEQVFAPAEPGSDELVALAGREAALRKALCDLPREQAHLVLLSYFEDRSHSQIASSVGLPLGTVKSRLRMALARLRAAVDDFR